MTAKLPKIPQRYWEHSALAAILLIGLILRLWGINFGLPHMYHIDEPTYISQALNLGRGIIGKQPNPTGFGNLLFIEYGVYFILGKILNVFPSLAVYEHSYRADPSVFLMLSRLTSILSGILCVLIGFCLGKLLQGSETALISASYIATSFLHVRDSHFGVPDILATTLVFLTVFLILSANRFHSKKIAYIAFFAGGLTIATKWSQWPIGFPLLYLLVRTLSKHFGANGWLNNRAVRVSFCVFFFALGFLLGGFQVFLRPATYLDYARREWTAGELGGFGMWQVDSVPGGLFYMKTGWWGMGILAFLLGLLGIIGLVLLGIRHHNVDFLLFVSFPVLYISFMGTSRHYFARYLVPALPFLGVTAAWAITLLIRSLMQDKRNLWIAPLLTVIPLVQPLTNSLRFDYLLTQTDTRTLAKYWIEDNIPEGARIALDWPTHGPPLATIERSVPFSKRVYDVLIVGGTGLSDHPTDWYRQQGFDYIITSSFISEIPLVFPERDAVRRAFYASLAHEFELIKEFNPGIGGKAPRFIFDEIYGPAVSLWERERPGPILRVYKVR